MLKRYLVLTFLILLGGIAVRVMTMDPGEHDRELSVLKAFITPIARIYLGIFGNPFSGIVLCFVMLGTLIWILWRFWFGLVRPTVRTLNGVTDRIRASAKVSDNPVDAILPAVRSAMQSSPFLTRPWQSFEAALVLRRRGDGESLHCSAQPSAYFSMQSLRQEGINLASYRPIAGYFVGVGLVLTFMGLVAGLYFASRGMMTSDLLQTRRALIALLNASTFKFLTSIVGIVSSIIVSIVVQKGIHRVETQLAKLCGSIEFYFKPLNLSSLIQDQIDEIRRQTNAMERLSRSIDVQVASSAGVAAATRQTQA